jgi:hypothetical protein
MKIGVVRLVVAIALVVAGASLWSEARLTRRLADAHRRITTFQSDADAESIESSAERKLAAANAAFRSAQQMSGDRAAVVERLDKVIEAYADALRADPASRAASYDYEYTVRYRDFIARGKGPVPVQIARSAEVSDLPVGPTIHGQPGVAPPDIVIANGAQKAATPAANPEMPKPEAPKPPPPATELAKAEPPKVEPPAAAVAPNPEPAAPVDSTAPRVFFVAPKEGARFPPYLIGTYERAVVFEFGIANYQIAGVPPRVDQPRPGVGHYHFGINVECIPQGQPIPRSGAWVDLELGESTTDMILSVPGKRSLVVQVADDAHRAVPGLCATGTITVSE